MKQAGHAKHLLDDGLPCSVVALPSGFCPATLLEACALVWLVVGYLPPVSSSKPKKGLR